MASLDMETKIR